MTIMIIRKSMMMRTMKMIISIKITLANLQLKVLNSRMELSNRLIQISKRYLQLIKIQAQNKVKIKTKIRYQKCMLLEVNKAHLHRLKLKLFPKCCDPSVNSKS